ncbi:hypothetical protein AX15_003434 [Amanita polypyramis BW_CC]|nr:hypothetical protein AX15_003434 [Amanita polypyramis BW_CC]
MFSWLFSAMHRSDQQARSPLSEYSTSAVPNSQWASFNFLLGAGMAIIQPSTNKVVIVNDTRTNTWFLPKGRKDIGESLEQAALREAYEESGYRVEFLPLYTQTNAPASPQDLDARIKPNTEPIFVTLMAYKPIIRRGRLIRSAGEYLIHWYVGQIPEDAVREIGTGMPDEQEYVSHLVTVEEAMRMLPPPEAQVISFAWGLYSFTLEVEERLLRRADSSG